MQIIILQAFTNHRHFSQSYKEHARHQEFVFRGIIYVNLCTFMDGAHVPNYAQTLYDVQGPVWKEI